MEEKEVLAGRIRDLAQRTRSREYMTHTGFLTPAEQALALQLLKEPSLAGTRYALKGGYPEADRRLIVFLPSRMEEDDPEAESVITCLRVRPRNARFSDHPGHRDYLGALMNLGITREVTGDILVGDDGAFLFVLSEMAEMIEREFTQVRHTSVDAACVPASECTATLKKELVTGSIASERIDALIGMVFHLSRSAAKERIEQELVFAGGLPVKSVSYTPRVGESISVRGYGKFIYLGTENRTKKGRLIAKAERFV